MRALGSGYALAAALFGAVYAGTLLRPSLNAVSATIASGIPNPNTLADGGLEVRLVNLEHRAVKLSTLRGRSVVLNFWATWCRACRENDRLLRRWQLEYADQGLAVVGLLERDTRSNLLRYEAPLFVGLLSGLDPDGRIARAYGAADVPQVVFIDRSGRVRATVRGRLEERVLLRDLRRIL